MAPRSNRESGQQGFDSSLERGTLHADRGRSSNGSEHDGLLTAAAGGDQQALERLTTAHLDWVAAAARERAERGLSHADLFQEGTIGLIEAISAYLSSGSTDFEAFARKRVAEHMDQALGEEARVVQQGQMLVQAASDYVEAEINLRRELGRAGTTTELAQKLEWSIGRTEEIAQMVEDARTRHDEELLQYLETGEIDLDTLIEDRRPNDAG